MNQEVEFTLDMIIAVTTDQKGRDFAIVRRHGGQIEFRYKTALGPWAICRSVPEDVFYLLTRDYAALKVKELVDERRSKSDVVS